ncbi:MAG: FAD-dependent oxidoreductase, partial [Anaerolineae bacterium]|nr:FAD-dependent oxidoreductase [Anaerolineae bacterium]
LDTIVEEIDWRGDGVRIRAADGTLYEAARAVITLPLGVLQAGDVRFDPPLPPAKQTAIDHLVMGPGMKMVYRFDEPITPPHIAAIYADGNPPMWWSPSYGRGIDGVQVWMAFTTGDWTRELLAGGEDGALQKGLETLRKELGNPNLHPSATRVMNWTAEPFTRGGYSVTPPGQTNARAALAAPLADRLYWAGEAAAREVWIATVHGAYDSGRRAAAGIFMATREGK